MKIDATKDLVFSNEKIPVPLTFPTDSPKSFIHAKTDNGSRISSLIYDKPIAIQWYNGEIVKSDFEWLADDFKAYLGSVNALGDLWQIYKPEIAPGLSAEFFEANKFILLKGNDDLPDNQRIDFDDESGLYLAINDTGRHVTSEIFMVAPNKVVFDYNQGYRTWYGIMGDESAQVYHFFITLNYAAPRGIEKDDYLNYELESISFDLSYDPHCAYSSAPQTGVDAVAYAAVAVVALAAVAVVVKKKRA